MEECRPALVDSQIRAQTLAAELYMTQEKCFLAMESNKTAVYDLMSLMSNLECMQADILKLGGIISDTVHKFSSDRNLLCTC